MNNGNSNANEKSKRCPLANNSKPLTLAVPKGRILTELYPYLSAAGVDVAPLKSPDRRLVITTDDGRFRLLLMRGSDIPTYVAHGVAELGIVGYDTLLESDLHLIERMDLGIAPCRLVVAAPEKTAATGLTIPWIRVASKYPRITKRYFRQRGIEANIIKLVGAVELSAAVGLADVVVDLVSSGDTLRANKLVEMETIAHITTRLIVNPASLKLRHEEIERFVSAMKTV